MSDIWGGRNSFSEKPVYRPLGKEINRSEWLNERFGLLSSTEPQLSDSPNRDYFAQVHLSLQICSWTGSTRKTNLRNKRRPVEMGTEVNGDRLCVYLGFSIHHPVVYHHLGVARNAWNSVQAGITQP
jgi:hypothetical protein